MFTLCVPPMIFLYLVAYSSLLGVFPMSKMLSWQRFLLQLVRVYWFCYRLVLLIQHSCPMLVMSSNVLLVCKMAMFGNYITARM